MIRVRLMREEDIWDVSTVRVRGWQAAYPGMVPQDYLDALRSPRTPACGVTCSRPAWGAS